MVIIAEAVAEEKILEILPWLMQSYMDEMAQKMMDVLSADVHTVVKVATTDGEEILCGEKTQEVICDAILREFKKVVDSTDWRLRGGRR